MDEFHRGFFEELENIQKEAYAQLLAAVVPAAGFAALDAGKAIKEQAVKGPRPEEIRQKSYLTKYPSLGLMGTATIPHWAVGKGMEALGRRGDTKFHRAMSMGAGTIGSALQADPLVAVQKGVGL